MVLWISGGFALLSAAGHDVIGALGGVAAAGAGAMEFHGSGVLRNGESRGLDWAIRGELLLLAVIWIYSAARLTYFDPEMIKPFIKPELAQQISTLNVTEDQFLRSMNLVIYVVVCFVSLIYQGLVVGYYARKRSSIKQAVGEY